MVAAPLHTHLFFDIVGQMISSLFRSISDATTPGIEVLATVTASDNNNEFGVIFDFLNKTTREASSKFAENDIVVYDTSSCHRFDLSVCGGLCFR